MNLSKGSIKRFAALFGLGSLGILPLIAEGFLNPEQYRAVADQAGMSIEVLLIVSALQVALFLAVAVVVGQYAAPKVGFSSHVMNRVTDATPVFPLLKRDSRPALAVGAVIGGLLILAERFSPVTLDPEGQEMTFELLIQSIPLRVLNGGITEEIWLRWGAMAFIAYLLWRTVGRRSAHPSNRIVWSAIVIAAILFGVLHLPAASTIYGALTPEVLVFIVGLNAIGGIGFGWLFWRYSLEASMIAHAFAHIVAVGFWMLTLLV